MAADPVVSTGPISTITWTFDEDSGYSAQFGTHLIQGGTLQIKERTPQFSTYGNEDSKQASNWITNETDTDGAPLLTNVVGETYNPGSLSAYDSRTIDQAAFKVRGRAASGRISANTIARSGASASDWNTHAWWMAPRSGSFPNHEIFVGTWTNTTTPEMGISGDFGSWNTYQFVSDGISVWPNFNTEVDTTISTNVTALYVLIAGREYTIAGTNYYDRIAVINGVVVESTILSTVAIDIPKGLYFGCSIDGAAFVESQAPAYFDSYRVWHGTRYTPLILVEFPPAQPDSLRAITAYSVTSDTTSFDRGGLVTTLYRVSTNGGETYSAYADISTITAQSFVGRGADVVQLAQILNASASVPATGVAGMFSPSVSEVQLTFTPLWIEKPTPTGSWTEQ